jgi:phosphoglycerate kinase
MKYLNNIDFKNKRVLIRVDYNVPIENGIIRDDSRIRATLPTINYILKQPKSKIVLVSHLGRPDGKIEPEFSLKPIGEKLENLLGKKVIFLGDIMSKAGEKLARNLPEGEIALAENIRFHPEEENNDKDFAIKLCRHFGVFVNDAFGVSHRANASISQIPRFKPSCAGLLMEKEIRELTTALQPSKRPAIAVIGGAKIQTKLPLIENLAKKYDAVLVGGRVSVEAKEKNIRFPQNVVLPDDFSEGEFDIGPKTIRKYVLAISAASFIVWNGPMGKFEEEAYRKGTEAVYDAIASADAWKIAGGGESLEYIDSRGGADKFNFISSGGGAMLEFLSGMKLPGIESLENSI